MAPATTQLMILALLAKYFSLNFSRHILIDICLPLHNLSSAGNDAGCLVQNLRNVHKIKELLQ